MAGRGAVPKENSRTRHKPVRGDWKAPEGVGWQFGDVPDPPEGLSEAALEAWATWMGSWFAAFWLPEDLPALRQVIRIYDQVERGEFQRSSELRLQMDTYGITPKGQQDRRWKRPEQVSEPEKARKGSGDRRKSSLEVIQGGG